MKDYAAYVSWMTKLRGMYPPCHQSCLAAAHPSFDVMLGKRGTHDVMLSRVMVMVGAQSGKAHGHDFGCAIAPIQMGNTEYDQPPMTRQHDPMAVLSGVRVSVMSVTVNGAVSSLF